jgi:hypothetical protein
MLKVKGRIVKAGQPYILKENQSMRIVFVPTEAGATKFDSYFAVFNRSDGTFKVIGKDGSGLPPGKYKVALEQLSHKNDEFQGAYSTNKSPFTVEVNSSTKEVILDLDQKTSAG